MTQVTIEKTMHTLAFTDDAALDAREVGGKGKSLTEMTLAGLPVPPGFTVAAGAYRAFLDQDDLRTRVAEVLADADAADPASLAAASARLEALLADVPLPDEVARQVADSYRALGERVGVPDVPVAVRSSATAEDSAADSFAGEFETWVDVTGVDSVLEHVRRCYTSVYAERVLHYALERGIDLATVEMAVVVQKVVRARAAGVMFTLDPISGDRSRIVLESSWGLGLAVVGGEVTPDRFICSKVGLTLQERVLGDKRVQYVTGDRVVDVPEEQQQAFCLSESEVIGLATLGKRLEKRHGKPQDVEFAVDADLPEGENLLLLQCRPETVWSSRERAPRFEKGAGMMSWITGGISSASSMPGSTGHSHGSDHDSDGDSDHG